MALSTHLISQFAKITNDTEKKKNTAATYYGTIVVYNSKKYVRIDGSDLLTPITSTVTTTDGDRVTVTIKDHTATVDGNITDPSASTNSTDVDLKDIKDAVESITEFDSVVAENLTINNADIADLKADNISVKKQLTATDAAIENLVAEDVTINGKLEAAEGNIAKLETDKIDANLAEITYAKIDALDATNVKVYNLETTYGNFALLTTQSIEAVEASIRILETNKLDANTASITYADVNFANITEAAVEKLFTESGIIKDLVVSEGRITGELVGVTIKGDLIEGNTVKADKLVIKGANGLYYKLNIEGGATTTSEVTTSDLQNGLAGTIIIAKSITAEKIAVDDLVAFDATIGGFNITTNSIYSGAKESVDNTTPGSYQDNDGQVAFGDGTRFVKFYYDEETGDYKLQVSADSITFGGAGRDVEEEFGAIQETTNDISEHVSTSDVKNAYGIDQLKKMLASVIVDEDGNSQMIITPEEYVLSSDTASVDPSTLIITSSTTTTGEVVYMMTDNATGITSYYAESNDVWYSVTYTPATCTFDISDLEKSINDAATSLATLAETVGGTTSDISEIREQVDSLGLIGGYIHMDEDFPIEGDTVPAIILGESDSEFKVVITNQKIAFCEGSAVPAYLSGQTFIAQNIEIKQELKQGGFSWVLHGGNLGLVWKG